MYKGPPLTIMAVIYFQQILGSPLLVNHFEHFGSEPSSNCELYAEGVPFG